MTLHDYLRNLSTGCSQQDQRHAIFTLANELGQPQRLVMPPEGMSCWRNAALTLQLMGRPYLDPALPDMMGWLKDMSWPGSGGDPPVWAAPYRTQGKPGRVIGTCGKTGDFLAGPPMDHKPGFLGSPRRPYRRGFRDTELARLLLQEDQTANR